MQNNVARLYRIRYATRRQDQVIQYGQPTRTICQYHEVGMDVRAH